jgi:predicted O-methyltransferase YrrM
MFKILKRLLPYKFKINLRKILNSVLKIRKKIINIQLNLFFRKLRYSRGYFLNSDLRKNLHRFLSNKSIQSFLEIGTFEGLASFWINKKYIKNNGSHIIVDPLTDVIDVTTDVDMINEENFYFNLNKIKRGDVLFKRITSDNFFKKNKIQFDFIYIDGSHLLEDIKNDLENSHRFIMDNGIIWCDDYLGGDAPNYCKIPIDNFYEKYKDEYEIIFKDYQIAFKKKISK